jgi:UDP-arabinose 4-epimerase
MATGDRSQKVILVAGGAGYIGSHTCQALAAAGWLPVTYDNLSAGHPWAVQWGPLEEGDLADKDRLKAVFQRYRPCAVMHFAGLSAVGESVVDPADYYETNIIGTLSLLDIAHQEGVRNIVFSSSCAVYGEPAAVPI